MHSRHEENCVGMECFIDLDCTNAEMPAAVHAQYDNTIMRTNRSDASGHAGDELAVIHISADVCKAWTEPRGIEMGKT